MIWWRRCSTHEEREGKAALVGSDEAPLGWLLSVCVCVCVFFFFFFFWRVSYLSGRKVHCLFFCIVWPSVLLVLGLRPSCVFFRFMATP